MKEVIKWKSRGKGVFAFQDGVKILQGSECALLRNGLNVKGKINGALKVALSESYAAGDLTHTIFLADKNCIQLRAPLLGSDAEGASFVPGQHFGHLAKDCAKAIAELMDKGFDFQSPNLADNSAYSSSGFYFTAVLSYCDSNRSKLGYDLDLIVHSENSTFWLSSFLVFLRGEGLKPILIV
jgi:hypothetical protein